MLLDGDCKHQSHATVIRNEGSSITLQMRKLFHRFTFFFVIVFGGPMILNVVLKNNRQNTKLDCACIQTAFDIVKQLSTSYRQLLVAHYCLANKRL